MAETTFSDVWRTPPTNPNWSNDMTEDDVHDKALEAMHVALSSTTAAKLLADVPEIVADNTQVATDLQATLTERGTRYGDFSDNAQIAEELIWIMQFHPQSNWAKLDAVKRQGLRYIAEKISRILSAQADPEYKDNWHDIAGYAKLVEDRCVVGNTK